VQIAPQCESAGRLIRASETLAADENQETGAELDRARGRPMKIVRRARHSRAGSDFCFRGSAHGPFDGWSQTTGLGLGSGISPIELGFYGIKDESEARKRYEETLSLLLESGSGGPITHTREYFSVEDFPMELQLVQKPFPPLWYGVARPATADWARSVVRGVTAEPERFPAFGLDAAPSGRVWVRSRLMPPWWRRSLNDYARLRPGAEDGHCPETPSEPVKPLRVDTTGGSSTVRSCTYEAKAQPSDRDRRRRKQPRFPRR
jgi:hypothetical protein